ncbi:cysteine desulfurase [Halobacteriales archaeon QH_6_66_25]|nr:MAG: cysteine desulfurase [Halobacteriales archaeon QH_6_66_25]
MATTEPQILDVEGIREDFPILQREFGGEQLVYLDNAATAQTPDQVIDAMSDYYRETNANVHRGLHHLSQEASIAYEDAHDRLAEFVGASGGREEMIFTKNTTDSENLVAYSWGLNELGPGDEVVTTEMEHHSSLVTWQQIAKRTGAEIKYIRVDDDGELDMDHAKELITDDTRMVSVVHVSNTLGTKNPVGALAEIAHDHDAYIFVDGAQSVPTMPVDVERKVTYDDSSWAELPWKFEAGTPPIAEGIGLAAAADYLDDIGMERIERHENELAQYAIERLAEFDDIEIYGPPAGVERGGLVSFNLESVHAHDLSEVLNDFAVAVRAGDHCTQPLHDKLGVAASTRASFYVYNTTDEIDTMVDALDAARELFA